MLLMNIGKCREIVKTLAIGKLSTVLIFPEIFWFQKASDSQIEQLIFVDVYN